MAYRSIGNALPRSAGQGLVILDFLLPTFDWSK